MSLLEVRHVGKSFRGLRAVHDASLSRAVHNAPALGLRSSVGEDLRGIALESLRTRDVVVATDYRDHPDSNPALHGLIGSAIAAPDLATTSGGLTGL